MKLLDNKKAVRGIKLRLASIAGISTLFISIILILNTCFAAEVKGAITPESIRTHHQALVDISSAAGGFDSGIRLNKAGEEAAEYLLKGYKHAGIENVRLEPFYPNRWWPEHYKAVIVGTSGLPELKLNAFPLWYCEGAKDLELEVVYAGFGTKGEYRGIDVQGKAVLIDMKRLLHFIQSYMVTKAVETAREKGAKAIIIGDTRIDSPTGNRVGSAGEIKNQKGQKAELFPIPVFSIGKSDSVKLKARVKAGTTKVRLDLKYSLKQSHTVNIVGELPGNGRIDEYIIIGGHYDTWFTGAIDNLGSQASLIEIAGHFARIPRAQRDRTLVFVSLFGHEFGNETMGHAAFVEKHIYLQGKVTCFFNVDGSGSWGWEENPETGEIYQTNRDDKGGTLASSQELASLTHPSIYKYSRGPWVNFPNNFFVADLRGPIAEAGFPVLLVINKHVYYHSLFDTIEKITPDQVYRRTMMNIDTITSIMKSPAGHLIKVDTNPHRKQLNSETAVSNPTPEQFPANPDPWLNKAPVDLSMHLLPDKAQVFSTVIGWVGSWTSDAILRSTDVWWDFGGVLGMLGAKNEFYSGTMYFFPGKKTISLTVKDSQGRSTSVSREIEISAGRFVYFYGFMLLLLTLLIIFVGRKLFRRNS